MDDPLRSARVKLKRANLHTSTARREFLRFVNKHPRPTIQIQREGEDEPIPIGTEIVLWVAVKRGFPELPESFAARFGDAIHNYRCALDHIAWQLVKHGSDPNPAEPTRVQFPIYTKKTTFLTELATRLPGVDTRGGGPCEFIEKRHRYQGGKARNKTLIRLRKLSNDDKHRELHLMFAGLQSAKHQVTFANCKPLEIRQPPVRPKLVPDAKVARLSVLVTGHNPHVEVKPNLTIYVSLEDWSNALDFLRDVREEVTKIVNAPEISRGL